MLVVRPRHGALEEWIRDCVALSELASRSPFAAVPCQGAPPFIHIEPQRTTDITRRRTRAARARRAHADVRGRGPPAAPRKGWFVKRCRFPFR
jgi:hypothetical protein